jgi:hypothetical protein
MCYEYSGTTGSILPGFQATGIISSDQVHDQLLPEACQRLAAIVYPLEIVPECPELLIRADVQPIERLGDARISDARGFNVLLGEDAPEGRIVGIVARTIRDKEHIIYP